MISISGKQNNTGRQLRKIIINNNIFNNFNPSILRANGVNKLEFTNNTINNSKSFPSTNPDAFVIDVKQIETLKIENNKISKDFMNTVKPRETKNKYIFCYISSVYCYIIMPQICMYVFTL